MAITAIRGTIAPGETIFIDGTGLATTTGVRIHGSNAVIVNQDIISATDTLLTVGVVGGNLPHGSATLERIDSVATANESKPITLVARRQSLLSPFMVQATSGQIK